MRRLVLIAALTGWAGCVAAQPQAGAPASPAPSAGEAPRPGEPSTADPDLDFARAMIAQHRQAVETARNFLARGSDRELRKLARKTVTMRERERAFLEDWVRRHRR